MSLYEYKCNIQYVPKEMNIVVINFTWVSNEKRYLSQNSVGYFNFWMVIWLCAYFTCMLCLFFFLRIFINLSSEVTSLIHLLVLNQFASFIQCMGICLLKVNLQTGSLLFLSILQYHKEFWSASLLWIFILALHVLLVALR